MNKIFRPYLTLALAGAMLTFTSCDDHDHDHVPHDHEGELITTMTLTMTPEDGGTPVTATFQDLDGDGGNPPVMTPEVVTLQANTTYNTTITVKDESHHDEDLTAEIKDKGAEHEFFFEPSPATSFVTVIKTDRDSNNRPIGLTSTIATGDAQSGTLRVALKHQPGGLKTDNSTVNTGETDIDVTYNITLE